MDMLPSPILSHIINSDLYRKYELDYRFRRSLVLIPEKCQIRARYARLAIQDGMKILGLSLADPDHDVDENSHSFGVALLLKLSKMVFVAYANTDTRFWENLRGVYDPRTVVGIEYSRAKQRLITLAKRVVKVLIATIALTQGGFLLLEYAL